MKKHLIILTVVFILVPVVFVSAQNSDETPPPDSGSLPPTEEAPKETITPSPDTETTTAVPTAATSVSRTVAPSPTSTPSPSATPIPTPRPPSSLSNPTSAPSPTAIPTTATSITTTTAQVSNNWALGAIIGLLAVVSAVIGYVMYKGKTQKKNDKNDRCGSIKELLEQKKKELEEMVRNWPEEKLKGMAKDEVMGELKKDEDAKKVIETAESLKVKHDKLKETIELLEKKYNLCTLEFPSAGKQLYKGTIVENSLHDKKILEDVKITKTYLDEDWTLHDVLVGGENIDKLGQYIADGPWYIHLWQEGKDDVIVIFQDKSFKIKYSNKLTWSEAIEYGKSKGIPEEQLNFFTH